MVQCRAYAWLIYDLCINEKVQLEYVDIVSLTWNKHEQVKQP